MKELNEQNEKNKLLKQQNKLLKKLNRQKKILEQEKLLEQEKQEEDIPWDIINELSRNADEMTENINSRPPINFRTFAPRRDPFDDINENKGKPTPPSEIPAPITKSLKPQGLAAGEQAGIEIMKDELKTSKNYIEI